jgi:hypothetical protein
MIGCNITSAWMTDGHPTANTDRVLQCTIADSNLSVAAKLVDLDPEQQVVSEIWGLEIRIADASGKSLLRGKFEPAAFMNIWDRWASGSGDGMASAIYQSVLTNLEWGDISGSPFLAQLREASKDGLLSIKFNVDAFDTDYTSATFTLGRIAGTIGPAAAAEPHHLVNGRQFLTTGLPSGHFFAPAGQINFCTAVVDAQHGKILLDLGNSLPTDTFGGPFSNLGSLSLAYETTDAQGNVHFTTLGTIDYLADGWYQQTAGVVTLPSDRALTDDELNTIAANPLVLLLTDTNNNTTPAITESPNGVYIRADKFVYRLNPGEEARIHLYATAYGLPYPAARVVLYLDPSQLQGGNGAPPDGIPTHVLQFPCRTITDDSGQVQITVAAGDPGNPRGYIDGQVYGIRAALEETMPPALQYPFNPWEFVSFLVWDRFVAERPTWYGCLQPVFQQYANLYPIMSRFLDLSSYDSICQNLIPLATVFGFGSDNPNYMPVTRDLSGGKQKAILTWLTDVGPDGKPLLGAPPAPSATAPAVEEAPVAPIKPGGKLAAVKRRHSVQRGTRRA